MPDELDKRDPIRRILDDCTIADPEGNFYVSKGRAVPKLNALFLSQIEETLDKFKPDNAYFTKEQILEAFQAKYGGK